MLKNTSLSQGSQDDWGSDDDSHFFDVEPASLLMDNNSTEEQSFSKPLDSLAVKDVGPVQVKFPGPAGMPLPSCNSKSRGQRKISNLTNVDGLHSWDRALSLFGLAQSWKNKKMNLQEIKERFSSGALYLTAPILVLGIQRIDYSPVIMHDVDCVLQDPTGEAKGRILQQVITEWGKSIQVGSVLVLRRPSLLQLSSDCLVTVTKTCLVGIYSPQNSAQVTQCHPYEKTDLSSWLSERVVCGEPIQPEDEAPDPAPVRLFTSATDVRTPQPTRTPYRPNPPTRPPSSNQRPFHPKASSSVAVTPRPSPYVPPSKQPLLPVAPVVNHVEDNFVAQFLDGIDPDDLFGDF